METFKINYKSDFVLRLASDAGWGTAFTLEFWAKGASTKRYYATHDGNGNYTNCKPDSDTELRVMFDDHGLGIGNLMLRITYSLADEEFRTGKDDEVVNVAAITVLNDEGEEVNVMLNLEGETAAEVQYSLPLLEAEKQRQNAEAQRIADEQQRQQAETLRNQAELGRQASEDTRKNNERARETAELQRQSAEAARVTEFETNEAERQATFDANEAERAYVKTSPSDIGDLNIADENGHAILQLENGNIKTKNFDSKNTPNITNGENDLAFADENGNIVFCVKGGHIFTKHFSSYVIKNVDCIGDSMVMGADWMSYFENTLQNKLGPNYNVRNFGVGGETKATIAARIGSSSVRFNTSFTLPSDGSNVELPTMYSRTDGYEVLPLKMGNANVVNPCYINGIECTMSYSNGHYYLRSNNVLPQDLVIRANSNLIMSTGKQIQESYCCIVWFGQNRPSGVSMTTEYLDSLVLSYEQIINQLPHNNFIFIGLHLLGYAPNNLAEYYENKMYNMVGNKFFNIREYCCSDLIYDAGIVPNETDLQEMSLGQCPESLLIDGTHFKPAVNDCIGNRLFELMNELGM